MIANTTVPLLEIAIGLGAVLLVGAGIWKFRSRSLQGPTLQSPSQSGAPEAVAETIAELPATMQDKLGKTRSSFATSLQKIRGKSTIDPSFWDGMEEVLLLADVGLNTSEFVLKNAQAQCDSEKVSDVVRALEIVKSSLQEVFVQNREAVINTQPSVWLFVGVNGVGKTTSIAKIGDRYKSLDKEILLVAGDTFRAAAADQLETWAQRTNVDIVRSNEGADPASVVFDGMEKANAKNYDLVLVDTAGRLHTKSNLMEEVKKIKRVVERTKDALKEVLLVVDATTGQNGLVQAREFGEAVGVTGVVLTKLDGSAKGGIALAIEHELGIPIKWVGLGEGSKDLIPFDPHEYIDALLA
jgi:fused signal recognition particle receptor